MAINTALVTPMITTPGARIAIESRWAEGEYDRYPALAADLVRLKVDVIVTVGGAATFRVAQLSLR